MEKSVHKSTVSRTLWEYKRSNWRQKSWQDKVKHPCIFRMKSQELIWLYIHTHKRNGVQAWWEIKKGISTNHRCEWVIKYIIEHFTVLVSRGGPICLSEPQNVTSLAYQENLEHDGQLLRPNYKNFQSTETLQLIWNSWKALKERKS